MGVPEQLELCNEALEQVGENPIGALDENTKPARLLRRIYPKLRDELLRTHPWNCATLRVTLAGAAVPDPQTEFRWTYALPDDCLRLLRRDERGEAYGWCAFSRVEGRTVYHRGGGEPIEFRYIGRPDETLFDPMFYAVLVARLATRACMPLANDGTLMQRLDQVATNRLQLARGVDIEEADGPLEDQNRGAYSFLNARW